MFRESMIVTVNISACRNEAPILLIESKFVNLSNRELNLLTLLLRLALLLSVIKVWCALQRI